MKLNQMLMTAGIAIAMLASAGNTPAQDNPPPGGQGGDRPGRGKGGGTGGGGNFDLAQFQQRAMENLREQMKVKDDTEWKALEGLIQKVMDAQREIGVGSGMRRLFRRPGGDTQANDQGGNRRRGGFGGEPSAEEAALDKAIDSGGSKDDLKSAMTKLRAAKKEKEAKLTAAQEELKKALTTQQEAVALAAGLVK